MDVLTEVVETGEEIMEMRNQLEELVTVLLQDNNIIENMTKKCERSEQIKRDLMVMILKMKRELVDEHIKRKEEETKVEKLGKALAEERNTSVEVKRENQTMEDKINYIKKKLKTCEMEKNGIFIKIERIRDKIVEEKKEKMYLQQRVLDELQYYKREMTRSRIVIQYGAKGMNMMKKHLEQNVKTLEEQKEENEKLKEELTKYKNNYNDRNLNHDLIFEELKNLEEFLRPRQTLCVRTSRRNTLQLNIIQKIKEQLTERYCRLLIT